jgi:hypothetical protein
VDEFFALGIHEADVHLVRMQVDGASELLILRVERPGRFCLFDVIF